MDDGWQWFDNAVGVLWDLKIPEGGPEEAHLEEVIASLQVGSEVRVDLRGRIVTIRREHERDIPFSCGCCGIESPALLWKVEG